MNAFPRTTSPYCPAWPPAAMAASRSRSFHPPAARLASPLGRLAVEPPRLDQHPAADPAGQQLTSAHQSVRHSLFRLTSRRARLIWSATRRRHCAICQATKTSSTKCVPSTATSSPSVTGSITTQLYKQQADLFSTEAWRVFSRLAAAAPAPAVLESISRHFPAGSLQRSRDPCSGRVRPSASARASPSGLSCISG